MRYVVCVVILMLAATPAGAGLYQCKDKKGKTYFSDRSCATKTYEPLKSGAAVPKLTEEEAKVRGGSMSVVGGGSISGSSLSELERKMVDRADQSIANTRHLEAKERLINHEVGANQDTKHQLNKQYGDTYKKLETKSGGDLSRCTVVKEGNQLKSRCIK